jgi:peptidoglycan/LPS O-acetylase OafA/YrhL
MLACWTAGQVFPVLYLATNPEGAWEPWSAWQGLFTMHFDGQFSRILRFNPALHIPEFVMGLCLGKLFLVRERFNGSLQRSGSVLSLVGFVAILAALTAADKLPFPMLHNGLLAPFFCMVIYGLALGGGVLPRVLGSAPFRLAGEASYGMYILQVPVWLAFSTLLGNQAAHGMGGFLLYLVCHFIVCVLVLWYVEEPARRWLKRLLPRERQTRAVRVHSAV